MTLDVYADLFDDDLDEVAARLNHVVVDSNVGKGLGRNDEGPVITGILGANSRGDGGI